MTSYRLRKNIVFGNFPSSLFRYFDSFRGKLNLLVISSVMIPLVLSSGIIIFILNENFQSINDNRLKAELETFSLILSVKEKELGQAINTLSYDNTLQMTLKLGIASQLQNYLLQQKDVLDMAYLAVRDTGKDVKVSTLEGESLLSKECLGTSLVKTGDQFWLCKSKDIVRQIENLGQITGATDLTATGFVKDLDEKLIDEFIILSDREVVASSLTHRFNVEEILNLPLKTTAEIELNQNRYKIILGQLQLDNEALIYGILLPEENLNQGFVEIMLFILIILVLTCTLLLFFARELLANLINPISKLISVISARRDLGDKMTELDFNRSDELGLLNRTFRDMYQATNKHVLEILEKNKKLKQAYEGLREYGESLENMVDARTEELNLALKEAERAQAEAEAANEAKSDFLANMSHELRTPLHGILGFARLMIDRSSKIDQETQVGYIAEIETSGKRLLLLLNDLLDLAKLEAGRVKYQFNQQSLYELTKVALQEQEALIREKQIGVTLDNPAFQDVGMMDGGKMIQVLRNLVSNAIKFSRMKGTIEIKIEQDEENLMFKITDEGVGIPKDELALVFDKFAQSSKTKTGAGGTGLGLAICKNIINDHKGVIWAENREQGGAVFAFVLPKSPEIKAR